MCLKNTFSYPSDEAQEQTKTFAERQKRGIDRATRRLQAALEVLDDREKRGGGSLKFQKKQMRERAFAERRAARRASATARVLEAITNEEDAPAMQENVVRPYPAAVVIRLVFVLSCIQNVVHISDTAHAAASKQHCTSTKGF